MGLFSKKENHGIKCPECGSFKTTGIKNVEPVMAYRGFYNAVVYNPNTGGNNYRKCKKCQCIFKLS
jgi:hypothetical protein